LLFFPLGTGGKGSGVPLFTRGGKG
jgi:hypothetical protein